MSGLRYDRASIRGDWLRCAAGLLLCGGPLLAAPLGTVVTVLFAGLVLLFAAHGLRTWERQRAVFILDDAGLSTSGARRARVAWRELEQVRLRFFATRRGRTEGWMQLGLRAGGRGLKVDSHLEGFDAIARQAFAAARANGVALSPTTLANFAALGLGDGAAGAAGTGDGPPDGAAGGP